MVFERLGRPDKLKLQCPGCGHENFASRFAKIIPHPGRGVLRGHIPVFPSGNLYVCKVNDIRGR